LLRLSRCWSSPLAITAKSVESLSGGAAIAVLGTSDVQGSIKAVTSLYLRNSAFGREKEKCDLRLQVWPPYVKGIRLIKGLHKRDETYL